MLLALFISLAVAMNVESDGTSATKKYQSSISASGAVSVGVSNLDQEDERSSSGSEAAVLGEEEAPPAKLTQSAARGSSKPMFYLTLS